MSLSLTGITKRFAERVAVDHVSLEAADGEFVVLLGPSGCGKSTLLRMVAGLETPDEGRIQIAGRDVTGVEPQHRDIAMVFQSYALYPHMTVARNIGYPLEVRKRSKEEIGREVKAVATRLGLGALLEQRPRQLSGGERQRVALARAIIRRPKAFLMDEPLSNLDARLRVEMRAELKHLQHELRTVTVYVTHDQAEAMTLAHRMAVMSGGKLLQYDTPVNVYHHPANTFVAGFIGSPAMNLITGVIESDMFVAPGIALPLTSEQGLRGRREVTLGIRPEWIKASRTEIAGWHPARVYVAEQMGNETILRIAAGSSQLTVRAPADLTVDFDAPVWFLPDAGKLQFFDAATGEALAGGG